MHTAADVFYCLRQNCPQEHYVRIKLKYADILSFNRTWTMQVKISHEALRLWWGDWKNSFSIPRHSLCVTIHITLNPLYVQMHAANNGVKCTFSKACILSIQCGINNERLQGSIGRKDVERKQISYANIPFWKCGSM